jgi:biotin operon repressor
MSDESAGMIIERVNARLQGGQNVGGADLQATADATERQIRDAISKLRRRGVLVVGNWNGYHLARNDDEVYLCVGEIMEQIRNLQEVANGMMARLAGWRPEHGCIGNRRYPS